MTIDVCRRFAPIEPGRIPVILALAIFGSGCDDKITGTVDTTPPEVEISAPLNGQIVSGVGTTVLVDAEDSGTGIDRIEVQVNGIDVFVDRTPPYSIFLPTVAEPEGALFAIQVVAFDEAGNASADGVTVTSAPRTIFQLTTNTNADRDPAWSPDGGRLAFETSRFGQWDVFIMDDDGGNEVPLTTNLNDDENPTWSPAGTHIAFDSDRAGEEDIWSILVVAGEPSAFAATFAENEDREPAWSLDGESILFHSNRGVGNQYDLWMVDPNGQSATQVTSFAENDTSPAWAPFGDFIAFTSTLNFASPHVYVKDLILDTVTPVSGDVGFSEADPTWSPFGNAILYTRDAGAQSNVWIMVLGRPFPTQVTFGTGVVGDGGAAWSPDGQTIAFHSDRSGNDDIYVMK
jgi:Tol biopolymer transport system component